MKDRRLIEEQMNNARLDRDDIGSAARQVHGLKRLERTRHAALEREGTTSIIPRPPSS
jgi:uncharacterized membrane protein YcaP (DUF421 family)